MSLSVNSYGQASFNVQQSHNNTNAPKADDVQSSLVDSGKEVARVKEKEQEVMAKTQQETKQQMDVNTRSMSMMGFGNKLQAQLQG